MAKPRRNNVFISWVNEFGAVKLARALDIDGSTISHWRNGKCPKVEHIRRITKLSKGKLTYADIIDSQTGGKRAND